MTEPILKINHLSKSFGNHEILRDIDFNVYKGDVTSIIGMSGSGKSTLLRCINLLETPTSGDIIFNGRKYNIRRYEPYDISRKGRYGISVIQLVRQYDSTRKLYGRTDKSTEKE